MENIYDSIQAILGRGGGADFVGGIDNEALDFSQLAEFINSDTGSVGNSPYFGETLSSNSATNNASPTEKLITDSKRNATTTTSNSGHSLPESPPDSSSEHPYSPQDGNVAADSNLHQNEGNNIYTTLGSTYKLNPSILSENLALLDSHNLHHHTILESGGAAGLLQETTSLLVNNNHQSLLISTDICESQNAYDERIYAGKITQQDYVICDCNNLEILQQRSEQQQQQTNNNNNNVVYANLQSVKKRKLSLDNVVQPKIENQQDVGGAVSNGETLVANTGNSIPDDDYQSSEPCLSESGYQCIRFQTFLQNNWHTLCDQNLTELPTPHYRVDADKGFNFSTADDAFVCQKKNHFQVTCHIQVIGDAQFVKTSEGFQKISSFHLHFYGVKHDCPSQTIRVEQSQSDRSKKPFHPVLVELLGAQVTKITVGRLHFSETTSNNMRKKGKPNPEQRYFQLVVGLHAHTATGNYPIVSHASQKIIVRASNPGQFESDVELCWQKGQTQDSIYHNGKVGIGTDRPDEALVINGNIKVTGHIIQPSDVRAKKNIIEVDTAAQLRNVQKIRVVRYEYEPNFASQLKLTGSFDTGVIAQEVAQIIPEAVTPAGDFVLENGTSIENFLVVNKERIFMENIGAVKELCKVTDNLGNRIDQLEKINRRLNIIKRGDSLKSTASTIDSKNFKRKVTAIKCPHDDSDELCSNKFIQIVIVILVLIMAFCLAAITTLYLMETARYRQHFARSFENSRKIPMKRTTTKPNLSKFHNTWHTYSPPYNTIEQKNDDNSNKIINSQVLKKAGTIGIPSDCFNLNQELENSNLCQIYCCVPTSSVVIQSGLFERNKTTLLLSLDKSKNGGGAFHTNDIEKQKRHKRNSLELSDESNVFDSTTDDQLFTVIIQGRGFNLTLSDRYLDSVNNYNFTYVIPVSKYMPDEYLNLIFKSVQPNIKEVEHCSNGFKRNECPYSRFFDDKSSLKDGLHDNSERNVNSIVFEVQMTDFQSKIMTYRAPLQQSQSICKSTRLGFEFIEYNFLFHRLCDE